MNIKTKNMDTNYYGIHEKIKNIYESRGLSLTEFAGNLNVGKSTVSSIISKKADFHASFLLKIFDKYPSSIFTLFDFVFDKLQDQEHIAAENRVLYTKMDDSIKDKLIHFLEQDNERLRLENEQIKKQKTQESDYSDDAFTPSKLEE